MTDENINVGFYKVINPDKLEETQKQEGAIIHYHNEKDNTVLEDNLYIGSCRITDNFNAGEMDDDLETIECGGLKPTTIGDLRKRSLSDIVMEMVCPENNPTVKQYPNASLSCADDYAQLIKVGDTLPTESDLVVSVNKGIWNDGTDYAGEVESSQITMSPESWGMPSEEGKYVFSATVVLKEGGIPKTTHNKECADLQYKGGEIKSNTLVITSVYPIQFNDTDITEMTDYDLIDYISSIKTIYITMPAETDGLDNKFKVYLPSVFSVFEVKQYNPVSGKYDISVDMQPMEDCEYHYIRTTNPTDTKTDVVQYEIKVKK